MKILNYIKRKIYKKTHDKYGVPLHGRDISMTPIMQYNFSVHKNNDDNPLARVSKANFIKNLNEIKVTLFFTENDNGDALREILSLYGLSKLKIKYYNNDKKVCFENIFIICSNIVYNSDISYSSGDILTYSVELTFSSMSLVSHQK